MAKNMWQLKKKKKKRKHYHIKWTMVSKMYGNSNSLGLNFVKWKVWIIKHFSNINL